MINKNEFSKMAKHIFKKGQRSQNPKIIHPSRDWIIGVLFALVVFGVSTGWSAHTYLQYRDVSITYDNTNDSEVIVYRESMVKKAIEIFTNRDKLHVQLKSGEVVVVLDETKEDPSATASSTDTVATSTPLQASLESGGEDSVEGGENIASSTPEEAEPVAKENDTPSILIESDIPQISQ
jgi:hypothetical protein